MRRVSCAVAVLAAAVGVTTLAGGAGAATSPGKLHWRGVATLPLDAQQHVALEARALRRLVGTHADVVAAVVTFDDPQESTARYATYRLTVNGVVQPGGS